eukprot:CAMPEP_0202807640 /NCGR_PEP_ID=MMETSP1389-20130828/320_1 /ASSEMBLY_ACC=CAM_ASM_000865 /TAXON_ID=302021 /ORGANISM="Rhodomonas sp., Strain CCMP768" /LENGTH=188 /DNA_ID=CAMNT_0049477711 /DNA_START=709 /DNA_END=1272 /DNA_ORIENTATION=+
MSNISALGRAAGDNVARKDTWHSLAVQLDSRAGRGFGHHDWSRSVKHGRHFLFLRRVQVLALETLARFAEIGEVCVAAALALLEGDDRRAAEDEEERLQHEPDDEPDQPRDQVPQRVVTPRGAGGKPADGKGGALGYEDVDALPERLRERLDFSDVLLLDFLSSHVSRHHLIFAVLQLSFDFLQTRLC